MGLADRARSGKKIKLLLGMAVILISTLTITISIWINLIGLEKSRIQEYQTLAQNIGQTSLTFVLLKQYDHLLDLMQLLTKTSHIQALALFIDGEKIVQAGEPKGEARQLPPTESPEAIPFNLIHENEQVVINLALNHDRAVDLGQVHLQLVFTLQEFENRKSNILTAITLILLLLIGILISFFVIARYQQRLEQQNIKLQQTQKQLQYEELTKSEMIRAISHHAMQFLTAIYGKLFNLLEQRQAIVSKPTLIQSLKIIRENTDALKRTLENLKDNERLSKGQVKTLPKAMNLINAIELAGQSFEESLKKRGLSLVVKLCPDPAMVWADPEIVKPVIMNLLDNAIKFSRTGGKITISVTQEQQNYLVKVTDQGPGIAKENWGRIFKSFVRLNAKIPGTGLGLSNARQLIQLHDGWLDLADSQVGIGSTFYFSLPVMVKK